MKRYTQEEKQTLMVKFNELRKCGMTAMNAAKECGVPYITLHFWEQKASGTFVKGARKEKNKFVGKVVVTFKDGDTLECESLVDFKKILPQLK